MKIRAGDEVVVITGKDKGKTGAVLKVLPITSRVVVSGINMRTKHVKARPNQAGQRIQFEASLHVSNVMIIDPKTKKRTRVGYKIDDKKKKVRIARKSGEVIKISKVSKKAPSTDAKAKRTVAADATKKTETKKDTLTASTNDTADKKSPFWKKLGFGAEAVMEAEVKEGSHMAEDHSVPDQAQRTSSRSHSRGK